MPSLIIAAIYAWGSLVHVRHPNGVLDMVGSSWLGPQSLGKLFVIIAPRHATGLLWTCLTQQLPRQKNLL